MDKPVIDKQGLIDFEARIAERFAAGELPFLIHQSGGNEDHLIELFKGIRPGKDWIFSSHRNHYHYLLAGGSPESLEARISNGKSMFVYDRSLNFYCSAIVASTPCIAAGVAWKLKREGSDAHVWCFVGDGAEDEGHFYEAVRYVDGWNLPCTFIIEDNGMSVLTPKAARYGKSEMHWPPCVKRYTYEWVHGHALNGKGKMIDFKREANFVTPRPKLSSEIPRPDPLPQPMKYVEAVKQSMEMLARDLGTIFVGYNTRYGGAYGTMKEIPDAQKFETPLAENLMAGLASGLALAGDRPLLFFERQDFMYIAFDCIANQMDKIEQISDGEFRMPVIIRAVVGGKKPFYSGITHTQDLTQAMRELFHFPVYAPQTAGEVLKAYELAKHATTPVIISERRELYEKTFNE